MNKYTLRFLRELAALTDSDIVQTVRQLVAEDGNDTSKPSEDSGKALSVEVVRRQYPGKRWASGHMDAVVGVTLMSVQAFYSSDGEVLHMLLGEVDTVMSSVNGVVAVRSNGPWKWVCQ